MAVLWGVPYFFIKIAVAEVSPAAVALIRLAVGVLVLLPLAWRLGYLRPALPRWPWILFLGVFYMALPFTLIPIAELYVPSSLTAIIISSVPLLVAVFGLRWDRPGPIVVLGLVVGFAGVVALVGIDFSGHPALLLGSAILALVAVLYAIGPLVVARRLSDLPPLGHPALAMCIAVAVLALPAAQQWPRALPSLPVLGALAGLGLLCTAAPFYLYYWLIQHAGAQRATLVTYLNPGVAVLLGVLVLHEQLTLTAILGLALILAGSWLATRGRRRQPAVVRPAA